MNTYNILKILGLYNAEKHCTPSPFACIPKEVSPKKASVAPVVEQSIYGGIAFVEAEDGLQVRKDMKGHYLFDKESTDVDRHFFEEYNKTARKPLSWDKYTEIKVFWAKGYSAMTAAEEFESIKPRNGYGYGERTLDNYWSVFNKVHSYHQTAQ